MERLKILLMPWRHPRRLDRIVGYLNLFVLAVVLIGFVDSRFSIVLFLLLVIQIPMLISLVARGVMEARRDGKRLATLFFLNAIVEGRMQIDSLPPDMQEDVKVELASIMLQQKER